MHGARPVRKIGGNYPAFIPQSDPHRMVVHNNIGTQKRVEGDGDGLRVWNLR